MVIQTKVHYKVENRDTGKNTDALLIFDRQIDVLPLVKYLQQDGVEVLNGVRAEEDFHRRKKVEEFMRSDSRKWDDKRVADYMARVETAQKRIEDGERPFNGYFSSELSIFHLPQTTVSLGLGIDNVYTGELSHGGIGVSGIPVRPRIKFVNLHVHSESDEVIERIDDLVSEFSTGLSSVGYQRNDPGKLYEFLGDPFNRLLCK